MTVRNYASVVKEPMGYMSYIAYANVINAVCPSAQGNLPEVLTIICCALEHAEQSEGNMQHADDELREDEKNRIHARPAGPERPSWLPRSSEPSPNGSSLVERPKKKLKTEKQHKKGKKHKKDKQHKEKRRRVKEREASKETK